MKYCHRWEDFPEQTAYYLKDNPECRGIRSRRISGDRLMASRVMVEGGAKIPRHYHEAEQMVFIFKGKARISTGDDPIRTLGPGDIWVVPSNVPHGVGYEGDVEAIEVVSPAKRPPPATAIGPERRVSPRWKAILPDRRLRAKVIGTPERPPVAITGSKNSRAETAGYLPMIRATGSWLQSIDGVPDRSAGSVTCASRSSGDAS
ncbi:MAG: cupin domain-containing protein [Thermodesulfobacteriota bacterium]